MNPFDIRKEYQKSLIEIAKNRSNTEYSDVQMTSMGSTLLRLLASVEKFINSEQEVHDDPKRRKILISIEKIKYSHDYVLLICSRDVQKWFKDEWSKSKVKEFTFSGDGWGKAISISYDPWK